MKSFTIENETNNITVHDSRKAARDTGHGVFATEVQFADLIGPDIKRLVTIWNTLPGVKPVTKFPNRKVATERIWKAIQTLGTDITSEPAAETEAETTEVQAVSEPTPAEAQADAPPAEPVATAGAQAADVAPAETPATKKATRAKKTPATATNPGAPREGSKTSQVIEMLKREGGTTLEEIMASMGWLKHTTRAMLSAGGSLTKKHGLTVTSEKVGDKRTYSIKG